MKRDETAAAKRASYEEQAENAVRDMGFTPVKPPRRQIKSVIKTVTKPIDGKEKERLEEEKRKDELRESAMIELQEIRDQEEEEMRDQEERDMSANATEPATDPYTPDPLKDRMERMKNDVQEANGHKSETKRTLEFHAKQRELEEADQEAFEQMNRADNV